jgi:NADH:ubiquinone oxidoreductase subunit 6 (subunit J)
MIGFILSLIGGLIILIAGALLVMLLLLPGLLGIVWGILIVIFGLLAYMKPNKMYGIIILILALINLIGTFVLFGADFFWIGSILSLLGGILVYIEK